MIACMALSAFGGAAAFASADTRASAGMSLLLPSSYEQYMELNDPSDYTENDAYTDISSILNIQLMKDTDTGEAWIEDVSYRPIFMADLYDYDINDYGWHYRMVDLHAALDSYESGEPWNFITNEVYADMAAGLDALYEFYGAPELDFAYDGGEEAA